jgi:hypothetical protein
VLTTAVEESLQKQEAMAPQPECLLAKARMVKMAIRLLRSHSWITLFKKLLTRTEFRWTHKYQSEVILRRATTKGLSLTCNNQERKLLQ